FFFRERGWVYGHRLWWLEATLDAVEAGGDQGAQCQIWIARRITGVELKIGRCPLTPPENRRNAQGGFAIIRPIATIGRAPESRLQPTIARDRRRGQGDEPTQTRQYPT